MLHADQTEFLPKPEAAEYKPYISLCVCHAIFKSIKYLQIGSELSWSLFYSMFISVIGNRNARK